MNEASAPQPRVLAYDRIAQNKRRAWMLIAVFALLSLPAAAFLAMYLVVLFAVLLGMFLGTVTAAGAISGDDPTAWLVVIGAGSVILTLLVPVAIYANAVNLTLRMSGARRPADGEAEELRLVVENLCLGVGIPAPRLLVVDSRAANAFSTGMSPERSSLVVTTGLAQLLDRSQVQGVLAHEVAQIAAYDTRVGTMLAASVAFLRLPFSAVVAVFRGLFRVHWAVGGFFTLYIGVPFLLSIPLGFAAGIALLNDEPAQAAIVLVTMSVPVYALAIAPLLGEVVRLAVTREQQLRADADAVLLARSSEPLATALVAMNAAGSAGLRAARSTAHLWTVDPAGDAPWWDWFWPATHPPVSERVEMLARMGAGIPERTLEGAARHGREFGATVAPAAIVSSEPPATGVPRRQPESMEAPTGFRVATEAVVYEMPDDRSAQVEVLPPGALVTVHGVEGEYVHVITPHDAFGYVSRNTPMTPFEVT